MSNEFLVLIGVIVLGMLFFWLVLRATAQDFAYKLDEIVQKLDRIASRTEP